MNHVLRVEAISSVILKDNLPYWRRFCKLTNYCWANKKVFDKSEWAPWASHESLSQSCHLASSSNDAHPSWSTSLFSCQTDRACHLAMNAIMRQKLKTVIIWGAKVDIRKSHAISVEELLKVWQGGCKPFWRTSPRIFTVTVYLNLFPFPCMFLCSAEQLYFRFKMSSAWAWKFLGHTSSEFTFWLVRGFTWYYKAKLLPFCK